jgi:AraC-like DNA-binding protein
MPERGPQTPLRLEIVPGVIAAYASQTVVILEPLDGSEVRARDVASGKEKIVPVCELSGAALGLSRKDTQRRLEAVRGATRDEWLRARRRERVVMRLIRSDGEIAKQVTRASRALGLSRSSIYRLLRQYRQAAQTSSLLVGHRGTPKQHRRLSEPREALVTRAIEEKYLARPRMRQSNQEGFEESRLIAPVPDQISLVIGDEQLIGTVLPTIEVLLYDNLDGILTDLIVHISLEFPNLLFGCRCRL